VIFTILVMNEWLARSWGNDTRESWDTTQMTQVPCLKKVLFTEGPSLKGTLRITEKMKGVMILTKPSKMILKIRTFKVKDRATIKMCSIQKQDLN